MSAVAPQQAVIRGLKGRLYTPMPVNANANAATLATGAGVITELMDHVLNFHLDKFMKSQQVIDSTSDNWTVNVEKARCEWVYIPGTQNTMTLKLYTKTMIRDAETNAWRRTDPSVDVNEHGDVIPACLASIHINRQFLRVELHAHAPKTPASSPPYELTPETMWTVDDKVMAELARICWTQRWQFSTIFVLSSTQADIMMPANVMYADSVQYSRSTQPLNAMSGFSAGDTMYECTFATLSYEQIVTALLCAHVTLRKFTYPMYPDTGSAPLVETLFRYHHHTNLATVFRDYRCGVYVGGTLLQPGDTALRKSNQIPKTLFAPSILTDTVNSLFIFQGVDVDVYPRDARKQWKDFVKGRVNTADPNELPQRKTDISVTVVQCVAGWLDSFMNVRYLANVLLTMSRNTQPPASSMHVLDVHPLWLTVKSVYTYTLWSRVRNVIGDKLVRELQEHPTELATEKTSEQADLSRTVTMPMAAPAAQITVTSLESKLGPLLYNWLLDQQHGEKAQGQDPNAHLRGRLFQSVLQRVNMTHRMQNMWYGLLHQKIKELTALPSRHDVPVRLFGNHVWSCPLTSLPELKRHMKQHNVDMSNRPQAKYTHILDYTMAWLALLHRLDHIAHTSEEAKAKAKAAAASSAASADPAEAKIACDWVAKALNTYKVQVRRGIPAEETPFDVGRIHVWVQTQGAPLFDANNVRVLCAAARAHGLLIIPLVYPDWDFEKNIYDTMLEWLNAHSCYMKENVDEYYKESEYHPCHETEYVLPDSWRTFVEHYANIFLTSPSTDTEVDVVKTFIQRQEPFTTVLRTYLTSLIPSKDKHVVSTVAPPPAPGVLKRLTGTITSAVTGMFSWSQGSIGQTEQVRVQTDRRKHWWPSMVRYLKLSEQVLEP